MIWFFLSNAWIFLLSTIVFILKMEPYVDFSDSVIDSIFWLKWYVDVEANKTTSYRYFKFEILSCALHFVNLIFSRITFFI